MINQTSSTWSLLSSLSARWSEQAKLYSSTLDDTGCDYEFNKTNALYDWTESSNKMKQLHATNSFSSLMIDA